jgi:hypothetical protein
MILRGEGWRGWFCFLFFGLCSIIFALQLTPQSTGVRLTADGFVMRSLFRQAPMVRWNAVSTFRVRRVPPSMIEMVIYDEPNAPRTRLRRLSRLLADGEAGLLPDDCGMNAEELAALLNAWRERHSAGGPMDA